MTSLSDTLTVGLVLVLLFGAIALYLYTRIQQAEQKISLLESILLDLKMSLEVKSFSESPAEEHVSEPKALVSTEPEDYIPFHDDDQDASATGQGQDQEQGQGQGQEQEQEQELTADATEVADIGAATQGHEVEEYKSVIAEAVKEEKASSYEAMTLKELQALAKTRGISGAGTMKKGPIIEALKTSDKIQTHVPSDASLGIASSSSFLDTSAAFPGNESN
jgi:hypothetical protein